MRRYTFSSATPGQFERIFNEAIRREEERFHAEAAGGAWYDEATPAPAFEMRKNSEGVWEKA